MFNKIILISNCGKNLSGKDFVNSVRKIVGFDILVLFYPHNIKHLEWIKEYPNSLYTNGDGFFEEYVTNFNEKEINKLKKEIEEFYNVKFREFEDAFEYPFYAKFENGGKFSDIKRNKTIQKNKIDKNDTNEKNEKKENNKYNNYVFIFFYKIFNR